MNIKIKKEEYETIVKMYVKDNLSTTEISKLYNVTNGTIREILKKNGITFGKIIPETEYDKILKMYVDGMYQYQIAEKYGVSPNTIGDIVRKFDVKVDHNTSSHKNINENFFDNIDNQDKAYILGLLYADGCNSENRHLISIALQEEDGYILEKMRDVMDSDVNIRFIDWKKKRPNCKNQYTFRIENKHLSKRLAEIGMVQRKSLVLEFPDLKDELIPHFLRGYFDGDGHIAKRKGDYNTSFISTYNFCKKAQEILEQHDINGVIRNYHTNGITMTFQISNKRNSKKFLDYIYKDANMFLIRKHDVYINKFYS